VFDAQLRQVAPVRVVTFVAGQQFHHQAEERRLRTAEVVAAVAIRDVAVLVQLPGEVVDHVAHMLPALAGRQAEQGEVAVPVIDLAEAAAGHYVRVWQRQQRSVRIDAGGMPLQYRPQAFDVRAQSFACRRHVGRWIAGYVEVGRDEIAQRVTGLLLRGLPVGQYGRRRLARYGVGEGLLVGKQVRALYLLEQRSQLPVGRRSGVGGFFGGCIGHAEQQCQRRTGLEHRGTHGVPPEGCAATVAPHA